MIFNPYVIAGALMGAGLIYATGYYVGASKQEAKDVAAAAAKTAEVKEAYAKVEILLAKGLADQLTAIRETERVVNRETQKIIERPVYRNVCLDTDGMRLIEQARTSGGKAIASAPAGKVP